jgi:ferredoxin-NADP reductase
MKIVFERREDEALNISTFYFRPEKAFHYTAGQYVELTLRHPDADDRGEKRQFTLSSSPTDPLVSITNKFAAHDGSSFKRALAKLKSGNVLSMSKPMGDFVLPKLSQTPLVFVAGGIGITPFHSMLSWLAATHQTRSIQLFYGVTSEAEIVFQSTFNKWPHDIIVSNPSPGWKGKRGQLTADYILKAPHAADTMFYLSGPEAMVETLSMDLQRAGITKAQLVLDLFLGYSDTTTDAASRSAEQPQPSSYLREDSKDILRSRI